MQIWHSISGNAYCGKHYCGKPKKYMVSSRNRALMYSKHMLYSSLCVCVCVCMYVCVCVCVYIYIYTHIYMLYCA